MTSGEIININLTCKLGKWWFSENRRQNYFITDSKLKIVNFVT